MPSVSIIIPTNRPWAVLASCLKSIAAQTFDQHEIEVIAVYNGAAPSDDAHPADWPFRLVLEQREEPNIAAAKNVAIERASGRFLIFINDDVRLQHDFVRQHIAAHERLAAPGYVLGQSHWVRYSDETVFDRMIEATPMVFHYSELTPRRRYDFRHAWNLNVSITAAALGPLRYDERIGACFFEDIELAFRVQQRYGPCVWFEPAAACLHEHRYTLDSYLKREALLGPLATRLWDCNPDCFRAIFKSDLNAAYTEYCRQYLRHEGGREAELRELLEAAAHRPVAWLGLREESLTAMVRLLYHAHLPLKRLVFRRALLDSLAPRQSPQRELALV